MRAGGRGGSELASGTVEAARRPGVAASSGRAGCATRACGGWLRVTNTASVREQERCILAQGAQGESRVIVCATPYRVSTWYARCTRRHAEAARVLTERTCLTGCHAGRWRIPVHSCIHQWVRGQSRARRRTHETRILLVLIERRLHVQPTKRASKQAGKQPTRRNTSTQPREQARARHTHVDRQARAYLPPLQSVHASALMENLPVGQAVHDDAPAAEKVPSSQVRHEDAPANEYLPAAQLRQSVAPSRDAYLPVCVRVCMCVHVLSYKKPCG